MSDDSALVLEWLLSADDVMSDDSALVLEWLLSADDVMSDDSALVLEWLLSADDVMSDDSALVLEWLLSADDVTLATEADNPENKRLSLRLYCFLMYAFYLATLTPFSFIVCLENFDLFRMLLNLKLLLKDRRFKLIDIEN